MLAIVTGLGIAMATLVSIGVARRTRATGLLPRRHPTCRNQPGVTTDRAFPRVVFVIVGLVTVFAAIFVKLADSVRENEGVTRFDRAVSNVVVEHRTGWITRLARGVTLLGSGWVVAIVIVAAAILLLLRRRHGDTWFIVVSSLGVAILVVTSKHLVGRPRPSASERLVNASGAAFPSGHAAQSVACYTRPSQSSSCSPLDRSRRARSRVPARDSLRSRLARAARLPRSPLAERRRERMAPGGRLALDDPGNPATRSRSHLATPGCPRVLRRPVPPGFGGVEAAYTGDVFVGAAVVPTAGVPRTHAAQEITASLGAEVLPTLVAAA